jgi:hypothetical protein
LPSPPALKTTGGEESEMNLVCLPLRAGLQRFRQERDLAQFLLYGPVGASTWRMRRFRAVLDSQLKALFTAIDGPLLMNEFGVGLGAKLAVLVLFAAQVTIGIAARW